MVSQKWLIVILVIIGVIVLGTETLLVRWYPGHKQRVEAAILRQLPYQNEGLGLQMQIAFGIYGKVQDYAGGVKIYRPGLFGGGPSITISMQPNTSGSAQFSAQYMADLETEGTRNELAGYQFQHLTVNGRDAVLIWDYDSQTQAMNVTARVMAPDRMVQAVCKTGYGHQGVLTRACDESLRSIQLSGPPSSLPTTSHGD
ncbi:MAG: hypothetical protein ACRD2B_15515 [Terriglobia bacterium]